MGRRTKKGPFVWVLKYEGTPVTVVWVPRQVLSQADALSRAGRRTATHKNVGDVAMAAPIPGVEAA